MRKFSRSNLVILFEFDLQSVILHFRWMQLRSKFQPLDERLTSVRSLSLVRMAVPVKIDPMLVAYTFYYVCKSDGHVTYATDQRVGVHATPMG